jgi:hypothetical protein
MVLRGVARSSGITQADYFKRESFAFPRAQFLVQGILPRLLCSFPF